MTDLPQAAFHLPRPVAFALSGGTSLGAIHVGMLRALHERGLVPDLLVGSSAGAVNAAFIGAGYRSERIAALASLWSRVRAAHVFGPYGLPLCVRMLRGQRWLTARSRLRQLLDENLLARHSELSIPTAVIATDLLTGAPVVLEDGDLRQNVLASAAIPGVVPPVMIGGRLLADGAIAAHLPVLQAAELGAASVVVLDTAYPCTFSELPHGLISNAVHVLNLVLRRQSFAALTMVASRLPVVYLPSSCSLHVAPYDFTRSALLVEDGHASAARYLADLRVCGPGVYGHPLFHPDVTCEEASA